MTMRANNCRFCESDIVEVVNFGKMPIANAFLKKEDIKNETFFELATCYCPQCLLFQLIEQPNPESLFHENYAFFANTSNYMQKHFSELSNKLIENFDLKKNDLTIEIGNNDGGMVKYLKDKGFNHLGIDPSKNVSDAARSKGVNILNNFFNFELSKKIKNSYGKAKIILSANTLAHIPNINSVFQGIENLLEDDGIYITEDPYQVDLFNKTSYDQIYDEHVFIFSLNSMNNICKKYNFEIFDVEHLETAGGSMRYYICKTGKKKISSNVNKFFDLEKKINFLQNSTYIDFKNKCEQSKNNFVNLLEKLSKNNIIASYGATSKSTTIFNYCQIDTKLIKYITDTTSTKINKFSPGMHIPIYDYKFFNDNLPDYCFLGAWNHSDEIFKKEKNNFSVNGKWITHVPEARVI